jgi:predicted nucleic acid-binding protein
MSLKPQIPPDHALLLVEEILARFSTVSLDKEEYLATLQKTAGRGLTGGKVYDALLLACAAKSRAQVIYTWNLKHFHSIAPELADRIQAP